MCLIICPLSNYKSFSQGDGSLFCGLHVDNGRIKGKMKTTLREIIEKYDLSVRLTPNQNIILCDIRNSWKRPITTALAQAGLLVRYSIFSVDIKWCCGYVLSILWKFPSVLSWTFHQSRLCECISRRVKQKCIWEFHLEWLNLKLPNTGYNGNVIENYIFKQLFEVPFLFDLMCKEEPFFFFWGETHTHTHIVR